MTIWSSLSRLFCGESVKAGKGRRLLERDWWKLEDSFPLATGGGMSVVGERSHQAVLREIIGHRWREGVYWQVVAQLAATNDNASAKSAVVVAIHGVPVGQIPKQHVAAFCATINEAEAAGLSVICKAVITGGFEESHKIASYGLTLDVSLPLQRKVR